MWGHSYEFARPTDRWKEMDPLFRPLAGHAEVWYCTNIRLWDYEDARKRMIIAANRKTAYNPSAIPVTLVCDGKVMDVAPGQMVEAWAYNGQVPGPQIRVKQGDRVRVNLTNKLPESTAIHFHGVSLVNGMDGVPFITQPPVKPGRSFTYEFTVPNAGSNMYHSHHNSAKQVGLGLHDRGINRAKLRRQGALRLGRVRTSDIKLKVGHDGSGPASQGILIPADRITLVHFFSNRPLYLDLGSGVWSIPVSEARDLNDSAKPLEWRYSRIDLWLEAVRSETKRNEQRVILAYSSSLCLGERRDIIGGD